ncbi:TetR/AcrR family transcriptional regulator [Kribbella jejuensis]|uniref:TetR family transcriptional regulator n=1 Tax=Kribbella jejuensis TaxID=236068 RepID=A0A542EMW9_9ACTN|nr:TetR/AcrR family transcriptional regulator [Kribbella jejuensis]TQJ16669.1 TetR family transcriptional regulator [Kribbella jejuensis]
MPRTAARGGPQTRARISQIATQLFLQRGFDEVTVAEVARAAGVSSVTVFKHFPRKEDLLLDRYDDAVELLRTAAHGDVLVSLRRMTLDLVEERHALSGLKDGSVPFFATVAASPALIARAREIADDLRRTLAEELNDDLLAAFFIAGYTAVLTETARRQLAGAAPADLVDDHRARVERLFERLGHGFSG